MQTYFELLQDINENIDNAYREYTMNLIPNENNLLGVRIPILRKIAKKHFNQTGIDLFSVMLHSSMEEVLIHGFMISMIKDIDTSINEIRAFLPLITNWSICDSFCSSLKIINKYPEKIWKLVREYIESEAEYEVRFAIVVLLNYYINDSYIDDTIALLLKVKHSGYYVRMAKSWALAMCYIKNSSKVERYLTGFYLDDFTLRKTYSKILDSYQVEISKKNAIRKMRKQYDISKL